ncbi:MAG: PQQ-binding-like beta-propeller repeat protein [Lentisphaerae bacterium]|jgi:outer membrane protein assembly factor BamB|nr:PQQ-binding-like beta-propeller repeat protein [Lentisphaerota bacterium]MBT7057661.1 PQQ-binding-like beta-propeller repeat protein [Lentisphaerota bacterium]MBT7848041.1 PQQ-binding-like beta-propeller repeat protein [Lentisphaerota bacterium]
MNANHRTLVTASLCILALACHSHAGKLTDLVQAKRLKNGLILLVNADVRTYDEAAATGCTVRGLESASAEVTAIRKRFLATGSYGKLSVAGFDGETLPCINGLVNVVLVENTQLQKREVMRVLTPGGTALIKEGGAWETHVKPWPKEMGEWNQYLCNADNNGVAKDSAGPPERMQWTAGSRYGRFKNLMPSVTSMVTANGRIYAVEDIATPESAKTPKNYVLLARDAFNGCELWRHPLKDWDKEKLGPVKIIPVQLQRLLVAVKDRVYCTDGFDGPVQVFDGATGDVLTTFADTTNSREIAYSEGVLYGIKGAPYAFRARGREAEQLRISDVTLYARDATSGAALWQNVIKGSGKGGKEGYIGGTLSVRGDQLCYITRTQIHCRNSRTGSEIWHHEYPFWKNTKAGFLTFHTSPPTIVMADDQLFVSELDQIRAYSMSSGDFLWESRNRIGYCKTGDLFVADGLVWNGQLKGLDPGTGEVRREIKQTRTGPMCHPRCYRNRITHKYYINSLTGGTDLLSLDGKAEYPSPWMRATCGLAMTPSYGRLYSSPYVCACEIGTMLLGFNCTYTEVRDKNNGKVMTVAPNPRLIKGPAFGKPDTRHLPPAPSTDWPTYRHDNARSGVTKANLPDQQKVAWKTSLPGIPTAPVVAAGMLFVAVKNIHTLFALDSKTGEVIWTFTADGPIDSPPTYYRGLVLMGSRDGWVYCLDARNGELAWRFSDMPDIRYMCAFEQLESAWPVNGSVMIKDDLVYFAAGRSSFLDGGIVVYALNPQTGEVRHRRSMSGPYDKNNFPINQRGSQFRSQGFRSGIFSSRGNGLFIRHQAFKKDLSPVSPREVKTPHLMASAGFLTDNPQHRTYWTVDTDLSYGTGGGYETDGPLGDIMVVDGNTFYEVRGYAPGRHSNYGLKPRLDMYRVISGRRVPKGMRGRKIPNVGGPTVPRMRKWDGWARNWTAQIPIAGHAMLKANDRLLVAGVPVREGYTDKDIQASYQGRKGGLLWTMSTKDGRAIGELELPAAPVWDGLAAVGERVYVSLKDGTVLGLTESGTRKAPPKSRFIEGPTPIEDASKPELLAPVKGTISLYKNDFEKSEVGSKPGRVNGEEKGAKIVITDTASASGKQSLAFHDAPGIDHAWKPIWETRLAGDKLLGGRVTISFGVMVSKETPGHFSLILRHYGSYEKPPNVRGIIHMDVLPDNAIKVGGKTLKATNGVWHHVVLSFTQGIPGKRRATGTITAADGGKQSFGVACDTQEFVGLNWIGLSAMGNDHGLIHVDNLTVELAHEPVKPRVDRRGRPRPGR